MSETVLLELPLLEASQAQKHVTHNEALLKLDALTQLSVISRVVAAPPASPADGDRYLVAATATGDWAGHSGHIAVRQAGAWVFHTAKKGWKLWVEDEQVLIIYNGTDWVAAGSGGSSETAAKFGVNTTADTTNRLSVSSAAVLLNHAGSGMQLKLNKQAAADTASLLFQDGFSGRAEMGLAGDDDFHFKVSADGSAWNEAIVIDRATGAVSLPSSAGTLLSANDKQKLDGAATVVALAAKPVAIGLVFLAAPGREGWFKWNATVPIATHQLDALNGLYVPPNGALDGAWVRVAGDGCLSAKWFGASGDGITDDTAAIAGAVAVAKGGWKLLIPAGTFMVAGISIDGLEDVHIEGAGRDLTTLKLASGANTNVVSILNGASNIGISKLTIDGNRANQSVTGHGIRLGGCDDVIIRNVRITRTYSYGIGVQAGTNTRVRIEDFIIDETGADGIDLKDKNSANKDIHIHRGTVRNWGLRLTPQAGIDVRGKANISDIIFDHTLANDPVGGAAVGQQIAFRLRHSDVTNGPEGSGVFGNIEVLQLPAAATLSYALDTGPDCSNFTISNFAAHGCYLGVLRGTSGLFSNLSAEDVPVTSEGLSISGSNMIINGLKILGTGTTPDRGVDFEPGAIGNLVTNFFIDGISGTNSIRLQAGANNNLIYNGTIEAATNIGDSGSGNIIRGVINEDNTPITVAEGGTGSATASGARTNLGLGTLATQNGTFSGSSSGTNTGDQNLFSAIAVSGQSSVAADSVSDTLTLVAGANVTITTDAASDTVTIAAAGGGGGGLSDGDKGDITVSAAGTVWTVDADAIGTAKLGGDISAAGKALLDDADAAAQRVTLGLGSLATQSGTFAGSSSGANTGDQNVFSTITVAGQSDVVSDGVNDTLTLVAGSNVTITTNAASDAITIHAAGEVAGPASATGDAIARFDGATGKLLQGSTILLNDDGSIRLPEVASPAVPATGNINLLAADVAGQERFAVQASSGPAMFVQPLLGRNRTGLWAPQGNATTLPGNFAFVAPTALGTATARNVAATNLLTRMRRLGYVSSATAGNSAGHYHATVQFTIGNGSGLGGFLYIARFAVSDAATVSGARMFVGLRNATAAPTNVEPSTLTNVLGVAQLAASGNLHVVHGGSAAQAAADLGANFPANTLSADVYELALFAPSNAQIIGYRVERLNTGHIASGTLSGTVGTVIPAATTFLGHMAWRCNNATALAVGIDVASVYFETEY